MPDDHRPTVAVIGSGVSGLTAAYAMRHSHRVSLFEADGRLGGHADTHTVHTSEGVPVPIDTGFIVHNERTYPHLLRIFAELEVPTRPTEMSMSVTCQGCGLSYAGGRKLPGLLAQPRRLADRRYRSLLRNVPRFHAAARQVLQSGLEDDLTWGQFLQRHDFGDYFVQHFAVPLVSCVWSCSGVEAKQYPAKHLFRFLEHHGMLSVSGSPSWRTVVGGSRVYVERIAAQLPDVRTNSAVQALTRHADSVSVTTSAGVEQFDTVVLATHADQALRILADANEEEKSALSAVRYSRNPTWLHTDTSVLPQASGARASWNYQMQSCSTPVDNVLVSYWMNRLHGFEPSVPDHMVTLNPRGRVQESAVVDVMEYDHPVFTHESVAAADRLRKAGGPRLAFAGAHLGWGFHEDGARSGVEAARSLGVSW